MDESESELRATVARFEASLTWLVSAAGERAERKFMDAKIDVPQYGGMYVDDILPQIEGYQFLLELLGQLKNGLPIPLVDVDSYYAHGKRWPTGMRLDGNHLVDTWAGAKSRAFASTFGKYATGYEPA